MSNGLKRGRAPWRGPAMRWAALALALATALAGAGGEALGAAAPVDWASAQVRTLRATVDFQVARPAVGVTVVVPASDPAAVAAGIGGTVTVTPAGAGSAGGGAGSTEEPGRAPAPEPGAAAPPVPVAASTVVGSSTSSAAGGGAAPSPGAIEVPAVALRVQSVPGAVAVTCGEDSVDLPQRGTIRIALHLGDGTALRPQALAFTVRAGAPQVDPTPTAAEAAFVQELNTFRAQAGLAPVRDSAALTAAAAAHAAFVAGNPGLYGTTVSVHDEPTAWAAHPGWSGLYAGQRDQAFGSASGGGTEVMSDGNSDPVAYLVAETVFHRDLMLSPSLLAAGAADEGGQFVLDMTVAAGAGSGTILWPPPQSTGVPTTFGGEWPSPLIPFPGAAFPVGTPVTWDDYGLPAGSSVGQASLTLRSASGGAIVPGYVLTPALWQSRGASSDGVFMGQAVAFIPKAPLASHARYTASLSALLQVPGAPARTIALGWSFTTGDGWVGPPGGVPGPAEASATPTGAAGAVEAPPAGAAAQPAGQPAAAGGAQGEASGGDAAARPTVPEPPTGAPSPALVAARLVRLRASAADPPPTFTDMYLAPWAAPAVSALAARGAVRGIGSGMFGPEDPLTRAQLAVALAGLVPLQPGTAATGALPAWARAAVPAVVAAGWMRASRGVFAPDAIVDRAAAVTVLSRMVGWTAVAARYTAAGGTWPSGLRAAHAWSGETGADLEWAAHVGLLRGVSGQVAGTSPLTRAQFAVLLWRLAGLVGSGGA